MEWMLLPLRRYFEFGGRSRRKEFWMFVLFAIVLSMAAGLIDTMLGFGRTTTHVGPGAVSYNYASNGPVGGLVALALFIPNLSVQFRRLHDTNRSAWWLLLVLIPLIGWIALLVFYCQEGTRGANDYGADPKAENLAEVFR